MAIVIMSAHKKTAVAINYGRIIARFTILEVFAQLPLF